MSDRASALFAEWLAEVGFAADPEMAETAARVTAFFRTRVPAGPPPDVAAMAHPSEGPVILRDLPVYSLCAHHLLPFHGAVSIGYVPAGKVAGLGAFAATVRYFSQRPQVQERLVAEIADHLFHALAPRALVVRAVARHMCLEMRGVGARVDIVALAVRGEASDLLLREVGSAVSA